MRAVGREAPMANEREIQELVARCVSCMVFYHNTKADPQARATMMSDVRLIRTQVGPLGLDGEDIEQWIVRPVEYELVVRYGNEAGWSLFREFTEAFGTILKRPALAAG